MLQPRASFGGPDSEPGVGFAQAQPPAALSLFFIPAKELDEKGGEFLDGAFDALAWEQRTQDRIAVNTFVEFR